MDCVICSSCVSLEQHVVPLGLSAGRDATEHCRRSQHADARVRKSRPHLRTSEQLALKCVELAGIRVNLASQMETDKQESLQLSRLPNMEASVLMHNVTRIVQVPISSALAACQRLPIYAKMFYFQENERLKKDLYERENRVEEQNRKINELIQSSQS